MKKEKLLSIFKGIAKALLKTLLVVAVAAVAIAAALWFSRYSLARFAASRILPHGEGLENTFSIDRLGLSGVKVSDVRLGGFPCAPSFKSLSVEWSLGGLRERRIDSVALEGLSLDFTHRPQGFSMPSAGGVGQKPLQRDVLQGWKIDRAGATTEQLDLSPLLLAATTNGLALPNQTAQLSLDLTRTGPLYSLMARGSLLGKPVDGNVRYEQDAASGSLKLGWALPDFGLGERQRLENVSLSMNFAFAEAHGLDCSAKGRLSIGPCGWSLPVEAGAKPDGSFSLRAAAEGIMLTDADPLVADALDFAIGDKAPWGFVFSANCAPVFELSVAGGVPSWKATVSVSDASVSAQGAPVPLSVKDVGVRGSAEGTGRLVKVSPCMVWFGGATVGAIPLGRSHATIIADGGHVMVSEAALGFCGGTIRLYSLILNLENLSTGFTLMLDGLQLSDFLTLFPQLHGSTATGRLYGRMPLRVTKETELRLGESFLYTPPGESGIMKISDPRILTDLLAQAGLPPAVCESLGQALRDMEYEVLRLDLVNPRQEDGRVAIRLRGKTAGTATPTPVNINTNINGPIERFLNLAIKTAKMKESFK